MLRNSRLQILYFLLLTSYFLLSTSAAFASMDNSPSNNTDSKAITSSQSAANSTKNTVGDSQPTSASAAASKNSPASSPDKSALPPFTKEGAERITDKPTGKTTETKLAQAETPSDQPPAEEPPVGESPDVQTLTGEEESGDSVISNLTKPIQISPAGNSGAAVTSIPIIVPPGRKGIEPRISLNYSSNSRNGWIGMGWGLDMGAIQRNTKRGVCYTCNDFVATVNGSSSELVPRNDWGTDYYEAKIEGAFSKYHYIRAEDRWEVTTKDGTKYFYGTDSNTTYKSRQDNQYGRAMSK